LGPKATLNTLVVFFSTEQPEPGFLLRREKPISFPARGNFFTPTAEFIFRPPFDRQIGNQSI